MSEPTTTEPEPRPSLIPDEAMPGQVIPFRRQNPDGTHVFERWVITESEVTQGTRFIHPNGERHQPSRMILTLRPVE